MKYKRIILFLLTLLSGTYGCFKKDQLENVKIKTGSSFYQECHCDKPGDVGINLKWFDGHDKEIVPLGPGTKSNVYSEWMDKYTYSLYISNVTKSISGAYKCATFDGKSFIMTYNVEAYDPPYFVNKEGTQYVVEGRDALITCEAKGETDPLITWYKEQDGLVEITNNGKYEVTPTGLFIKVITKHDSGVYRCTASDLETGEGIDQDINVEVISTPSITELIATPNSKIFVGETLTIECIAGGIPHPDYSWKKISDSESQDTNVTWKQSANRLIIESVVPEDQGTYECSALNTAGNDSMGIPIKILVPPKIARFEPVTTVEGLAAQVVCKAAGRPAPRINIVFLGEDTAAQSIVWDVKNISDSETEFYLTFLKVNRTHDGTYICEASNEVNNVTQEMNMTVFYPPFFYNSFENAWSWSGKGANLSCEHLSNPAAEITWRYHVNVIPEANQVDVNRMMADKMHDTWLWLGNASLYGLYECVARNEYGESKKVVNLQEGFVPPTISNVSVIDITATSVTFAIDGPEKINGPPLIGFRSEYDEARNYNVTDIHINRTWAVDRPCRLDKLKPNSSYFIKFAAINDVGAGEWSEFVEFTTLERNPATSPPETPTWQVNSQEVAKDYTLKWSNLDGDEPVDYYIIKQCPVYTDFNSTDYLECEVFTEESTEHRIKGADSNVTYYFGVVAHNALGNSSALHMLVTLAAQEETSLTSGAIIGISILVVFLCFILLDLLLLKWRGQGMLAKCCIKKKNENEESLNFRDKKGLLKEGDNTKRPSNGHKEYEYNKTTGVITGKHSAV